MKVKIFYNAAQLSALMEQANLSDAEVAIHVGVKRNQIHRARNGIQASNSLLFRIVELCNARLSSDPNFRKVDWRELLEDPPRQIPEKNLPQFVS